MTYDFHSIALALSGPRGSGRTYNTIKTAPDSACIFVANEQQGDAVLNMALDHGRRDLSTLYLSSAVRGLKGPFVIDHHAVEQLLHEAGRIQDENAKLKLKLSEYEKGIDVEKADKEERYLMLEDSNDSEFTTVTWCNYQKIWRDYLGREMKPHFVFPLPAVKEDT